VGNDSHFVVVEYVLDEIPGGGDVEHWDVDRLE